MIRYHTDSAFADHTGPQVFHAFFTRAGGVSAGIYAGLNCGPLSADDPACVAENRARAAAALDVPADRLVTLKQTHSAICHVVQGPCALGRTIEGDALVTDRGGLALGVLTADCAPVLLAGRGPSGPVVGAAHAGWKGALGGILEATLQAMESLGTAPKTIQAVIGPCIARPSYAVGEDFLKPFLAQDPSASRFFTPYQDGFLFDLPAYCGHRLTLSGVSGTGNTGHDTCAQEGDFYSFRRATHRGESDYGRGLSAIVIRPFREA